MLCDPSPYTSRGIDHVLNSFCLEGVMNNNAEARPQAGEARGRRRCLHHIVLIKSGNTDPVQFKKGLERERGDFLFFKSFMLGRRQIACKKAHCCKQIASVLKPRLTLVPHPDHNATRALTGLTISFGFWSIATSEDSIAPCHDDCRALKDQTHYGLPVSQTLLATSVVLGLGVRGPRCP